MISARDWSWTWAGRSTPAVAHLDLEIATGERVLLLGGSGVGKSTVLAGLTGVLGGSDEGTETGNLLVGGSHPTRMRGRVGLVMQDPDSQVVLARVGDDIAFGAENMGMDPARIWPRVHECLGAVGLDVEVDRPTSRLSGGQKQRMAIAAALVMQDAGGPQVLCLDEPTANLDPAGITEVRDAIVSMLSTRPDTTLIVVEHRVEVWADLMDRVIVLGPGGVIADGPVTDVLTQMRDELLDAGVWVPGAEPPAKHRMHPTSGEPVLWAEHLDTGYQAGDPVSHDLDIAIPRAVSTVITGPNAVGKSTLALTLAGLLKPLAGSVIVADDLRPDGNYRGWLPRRMRRGFTAANPHTWASRDLLTRIGTVFQHPGHQFVERRVRDELAVGLVALGWCRAQIDTRVGELLETLHLSALAEANPFTLSGGEQRRLSVGTVLATSPSVIFLDEPTFGQDRNTWADLVALISEILDEGRTIVSVTHDAAFCEVLGDNTLCLEPR